MTIQRIDQKELLAEIHPVESESSENILDRQHIGKLMTEDYREGIHHAYDDAKRRTLW